VYVMGPLANFKSSTFMNSWFEYNGVQQVSDDVRGISIIPLFLCPASY
jgi:hypothetical protein